MFSSYLDFSVSVAWPKSCINMKFVHVYKQWTQLKLNIFVLMHSRVLYGVGFSQIA